jgi:hypothetical protein
MRHGEGGKVFYEGIGMMNKKKNQKDQYKNFEESILNRESKKVR